MYRKVYPNFHVFISNNCNANVLYFKIREFLCVAIKKIKQFKYYVNLMCTFASKINGTLKGVYLPISKLHSILAVTNLFAHSNISQICYCGQISIQCAAVNFSCSVNFGVHLFCWWWYNQLQNKSYPQRWLLANFEATLDFSRTEFTWLINLLCQMISLRLK